MFKKRKSESYLVVSSSQLGIDQGVLDVFARVAKHYKAKVVHVGPTATDKEMSEYKKLSKKISIAENSMFNAKTDAQDEKAREVMADAERALHQLENDQDSRIQMMVDGFGKLTVVVNKELSLPIKKNKNLTVVPEGLELSKYMFLSAITPRGMKATRNPMSKQAITHLKQKGKNWIVGFPVPSVECLAKPGLNESYNYWTVGSMTDTKTPHKHNELYQSDHLPCAIFVLIDKETEEFHARQMHIDYLRARDGSILEKFVVDDGLVFLPNRTLELGSEDLATVSTDDHAPFQHPGTLAAVRATNMMFKPKTFINAGDAGSFESINHHEADSPGTTEGMRLADDLSALRRLLSAQANVPSIKEKILIDSNHHEWITRFVMKNPVLKGMLDWVTLSNTMFKDWTVMIRESGDNKVYYFGDLMIRHGDKDGGPKKAETISHSNKYLCGHFHRFMSYRRSMQLGCGAMLGPSYIGNQVNAWQSQFATLTKYKGITGTAPKIVLHDKHKEVSRFSYRGDVYEVPHYKIS